MLKQNQNETFVEALKEDTEILSNLPYDFNKKSAYLDKFDGVENVFISRQWNEAKVNIKKWENPRTLVNLGDVHLMKKDFGKAIKLYNKALAIDKELLGVYEKLILIYLQQKKIDEVDKVYKSLIGISNKRPDFLHNYILFKLFFYKNDKTIEKSIEDINYILKAEKNNFYAYNTKGFIFLNFKNNIIEAKKQFLNALKLNNKFAHSLNNLGVCYIKENNTEKARKYFISAIENDNLYSTAYENLAGLYIQKRNFKEALKTLESSLKNNVELSELWQHQIGWILIQLNKNKEAIDWYEKKIKEEPDNNLLYNNLGFCYLKLNNIKKAKDNFRLAINIFRRQLSKKGSADLRGILAFYNMGRVYINTDNYQGIEEISKELMSYVPENAFARYLKGYMLILKKDYEGAKEFFLEALELDENIPDIYPNLAFIYESIDKDYEAAIKYLNKSLSKKFINDLALNNLAYAYLKSGQLEKAEEILNLYKDKPPVILANKGLLSFLKGNREQGDLFYKKAIRTLPSKVKPRARQHWLYERAQFFLRAGNISEAKKNLRKAKKLPNSHLTTDIINLEKELL